MEPGVAVQVAPEDVWQRAHKQGLPTQRQLAAARGGVIPASDVAIRLHLAPPDVEKLRRTGRLLALRATAGGFVYPVWQFVGHDVLPGLADVLAEFDVQDPWDQVAFLLSENIYLDDGVPLDELRRGRVDAVRRAARAYGEHGAP
jgi:hypothetical protein